MPFTVLRKAVLTFADPQVRRLAENVNSIVDRLGNTPEYFITQDEIAAGVTPTNKKYQELDPVRYGGDVTASDNYAALQAAFNVAKQKGGGNVPLRGGLFRYTGTTSLVIYAGTTLFGEGPSVSGIRYTGTSHIDVLTVDPSLGSDEQVIVRDLQLAGGLFQTGAARYSFYATTFGRGCELSNVWLREGLGTLYIGTATYSHIENLQCGPVVPTQSANGCSSAQYNAVYDENAGSFYINGNSISIKKLQFQSFVTENDDGGSTPENAIFVQGSAISIDDLSIETVTDARKPNTVLTLTSGKFDIRGFYSEAVNFTTYYMRVKEAALVSIKDINFLNIVGGTLIENGGTGEVQVSEYTFYDMDVNRAYNVPNSGISAGGGVRFRNGNWASGARVTDAGVNGDTDNVNDTVDDDHPLGATNGTYRRANDGPRMYPRKISGLTVTAGSDGDGDYVQVTGGVFMTERGEYITLKRQTSSITSNLVVYRLRPQTASKYYEVYVGDAGNLYLVQNDSATTSWRGDKLAEFDTDGSNNIQNLTNNPLLSVRGQYTPGTNRVVFYVSSVPTATDKRYGQGDMAIHEDAASAEVAFWIYSGSAWLAGPNMA